MLSLLAIFLINIVLFFILYKISELIFKMKAQLKSAKFSVYWAIAAFACLFLISLITNLISVKLIANFISPQSPPASAIVRDIDRQDCTTLLNTINLAKDRLTKLDGHRNIEDTSPLFTIKLEYQQGATQLRESAARYQELNLTEKSKSYSQTIATKMQEKADFYEERTKLISDTEGNQKILQLLAKMDRVTQEREKAIATVEKQCTLP
jgi:hypothetical protein